MPKSEIAYLPDGGSGGKVVQEEKDEGAGGVKGALSHAQKTKLRVMVAGYTR